METLGKGLHGINKGDTQWETKAEKGQRQGRQTEGKQTGKSAEREKGERTEKRTEIGAAGLSGVYQSWMNLQAEYDLEMAEITLVTRIIQEVKLLKEAA